MRVGLARLLSVILVTLVGLDLFGPGLTLPAVARALTLPTYQIDATLDVDRGSVTVRQTVRFRNAVGRPLESVVFRAVPGSWRGLEIDASRVDGRPRPAQLDGSVLEIPFEAPLAAGADADIELSYVVRIPREAGRASASSGAIALGNWFPILGVHRGDWDRRQYIEAGDAFYTEVADYDVTLTTSRPLEVAATGRLVEREGNRWRFEAPAVRDFAIAAASYAVHSVATGATTVTGYAPTPQLAQRYAERGAELVRWFGDRLGAYPYPSLAIAETNLPPSFAGMEYPGLIMLTPDLGGTATSPGSSRDVLIAHEVAHQWFYSWVGNDQIADPWLDEALATYIPVMYYADVRPDLYQTVLNRSIGGESESGRGPIDGSIYDFDTDAAYYRIVYRDGGRFLHTLRSRLGDAAFFALLRDHISTHRDRLATPRAVLDRAQAATSANLNPLFGQYFNYAAFHYPTPQVWTLELPPAPWEGSVSLFVGAEFPVARVELWLDGRLLAGGPENAVTFDLEGVEAGEYVLLARIWNHEGAVFERTRRVEVGGGSSGLSGRSREIGAAL